MLKMVIDPGHYAGYNKGIAAGYYEGDMVWKLAGYLKKELEKGGAEAILTRTFSEANPGLYDRGQAAVKNNAQLFLSLHSNAVGDVSKYEKAYGVSIYRSLFLPGSEDLGHKLADAIVSVMAPITGATYSRGVLTRKSDNTGRDYYGVIRGAVSNSGSDAEAKKGPVQAAFIVEHGFHTNSRECAFLNDDANIRKIAAAEAKVILEHYGLLGDPEAEYTGLPVMGESTATEEQLTAYLLANNPGAVDFLSLPGLYLEEGNIEGVRGDAAFMQACKETGFFRFRGDVGPGQNNFCGLGATGGGNPGLTFETQRAGVRAHIQHAKAYGSTLPLVNVCIDPRFKYVKRGIAPTFEELSGKWAVPGYDTRKYASLKAAMAAKDAYGDNIVSMLAKALRIGGAGQAAAVPDAPKDSEHDIIPPASSGMGVIGQIRVIYEGANGLNIHLTPEWGNHNINVKNGPVHGGTYRVTEKVKAGSSYMYKLYSGAGYITADERYVTFTPIAVGQVAERPVTQAVKAGDTVRVLKAEKYAGGSFKVWHDKYAVLKLDGDRAVIGVGGVVTAAVNVCNLEIA